MTQLGQTDAASARSPRRCRRRSARGGRSAPRPRSRVPVERSPDGGERDERRDGSSGRDECASSPAPRWARAQFAGDRSGVGCCSASRHGGSITGPHAMVNRGLIDAVLDARGHQPLQPLERPLDGGAMEVEPLGELGEGRPPASRAGRRRRARTRYGWRASRPSASSSAIAASCRPAASTARVEVGRLGVDHPVQVAPHRPRDLARSSSSSAAPAPALRRNVPTVSRALPGHDAAPRPDPPRRRQSRSSSRAARVGPRPGRRRTRGGSRPLERLSEPWPRKRPRRKAIRQ